MDEISRYLNLGYNAGINGTVPAGISALSNLTALTLVSMSLSGTIPSSIGALTKLS